MQPILPHSTALESDGTTTMALGSIGNRSFGVQTPKSGASLPHHPLSRKLEGLTQVGKALAKEGRTCIQKKISQHCVRPPTMSSKFSGPSFGGLKKPIKNSLPAPETSASLTQFVKQFAEQMGPHGIVQVASLSAEFMRPKNGRLLTGMAQAAALGMSLHERKKTGLTTKEAILEKAPEVAASSLEIAANLMNIRHRTHIRDLSEM